MRVRKRVFLGALLIVIIFVSIIGLLLWQITFNEQSLFYQRIFFFVGLVMFFSVLIMLLGLLGIVYSIITGNSQKVLRRPSKIIITHFLPLVIKMGKLFHIAKEKIELSFIEVNNALVKSQIREKTKTKDLLIMAPHCMQNADCPYRITTDIKNCKRCGKCGIGDLVSLAEEYNINVVVVTGGTIARRLAVKYRPRAIVAIACERDLTSGIQDIFPLPALGVVNIRPEGPCYNTTVDLKKVRSCIETFLDNREPKQVEGS